MDRGPMVHLTSVHHPFHARVIAARLGSDGILTELRGQLDSPYPVAGEVAVYVVREDLPVARELLLADQVESCFDEAENRDLGLAGGPEGPRSAVRWIAAVTVVLIVTIVTTWFARLV
ncbi:MAG: hypothetical protein ACRD1K_04755 [Acidimicrobiales bacterium]